MVPDENFSVPHNRRGILGMANKGRHTNGSQFYITLQPTQWMDTKYVAFGYAVLHSNVVEVVLTWNCIMHFTVHILGIEHTSETLHDILSTMQHKFLQPNTFTLFKLFGVARHRTPSPLCRPQSIHVFQPVYVWIPSYPLPHGHHCIISIIALFLFISSLASRILNKKNISDKLCECRNGSFAKTINKLIFFCSQANYRRYRDTTQNGDWKNNEWATRQRHQDSWLWSPHLWILIIVDMRFYWILLELFSLHSINCFSKYFL